jgi:hypothetical protein
MTSLSQSLQAVVTLFEGPLSGVRFADIDAAGLSQLAAEVSRVQAEVETHESKLVELKQSLVQRHEALLSLAQQALSYARIYAEGDEALTAQLNDITLPRAAKPRKAKPQPAEGTEAAPADMSVDIGEPVAAAAAAEEEPEAEDARAEAKPAYARPKIKRKLARASVRSEA